MRGDATIRTEAAVSVMVAMDFFLDRKHAPRVSERIQEISIAPSVELVGDWALQLGTGSDGALREGVHVGNLDSHRYRRIASGLRAVASALRPLFRQHDDGISNHDFGVGDTLPHLESESLFRCEGILVKLDRFRYVLEGHAWGCNDANGSSSFGHGCHG